MLWGDFGVTGMGALIERFPKGIPIIDFGKLPSVFWFGSSPQILLAAIAIGIFASVSSMFWRRWRRTSLLIACVIFISFATLSNSFLVHLWDRLLIESTLLLLCFDYFSSRGKNGASAFSRWMAFFALICLRFLVFRYYIGNGTEKFWGFPDPRWEDLSFFQLFWHHQTFPTNFAYLFSQIPDHYQIYFAYLTFLLELVVPVALFSPWKMRRFSLWLLFSYNIAIMISGNFSILNLLNIALLLSFVPEEKLRFAQWKLKTSGQAASKKLEVKWLYSVLPFGLTCFLATQLLVQFVFFANLFYPQASAFSSSWVYEDEYRIVKTGPPLPPVLRSLTQILNRSFLVNTYGLFGSGPLSSFHIRFFQSPIDSEIHTNGLSRSKFLEELRLRQLPQTGTKLPWFNPVLRYRSEAHVWLYAFGFHYDRLLPSHFYYHDEKRNWFAAILDSAIFGSQVHFPNAQLLPSSQKIGLILEQCHFPKKLDSIFLRGQYRCVPVDCVEYGQNVFASCMSDENFGKVN